MSKNMFAGDSSRYNEYTSPINYHRHKCNFCGYVWEHHNINDVSHNASPGSHECPACHRCNWEMGIYNGPTKPGIRNGKVPPDEPTPEGDYVPIQPR